MADQGTEGVFSPLLRARRIRAAVPFLRGEVLDFGCGAGALAAWVRPEDYWGVDRDCGVLQVARSQFPRHRFSTTLPEGHVFETVAALAVVEHLPNPVSWLRLMRRLLAPGGRVVITTPHPAFRLFHEAGAWAGLFSREATAEHKAFFGRADLAELASRSGFRVARYARFLFGANQFAVLTPEPLPPSGP